MSVAPQTSCMRIFWENDVPKLKIIGPGHLLEFDISADQLDILMSNYDSEYTRLKYRSRRMSKCAQDYLGDIFAFLQDYNERGQRFVILTLVFGEAGRDLKFLETEDSLDPQNPLEVREYYFKKEEFTCFVKCIQTMDEQRDVFKRHQCFATVPMERIITRRVEKHDR